MKNRFFYGSDQEINIDLIPRLMYGRVVNISGAKSVKVANYYTSYNLKYKKHSHLIRNFIVHDELSLANVGDWVAFKFCRCFSKRKYSKIIGISKNDI